MMWTASDGPVPLARALKGSGAMLLPPPLPLQKKSFRFFPSKAPFTEFLRLEKRCEGMI